MHFEPGRAAPGRRAVAAPPRTGRRSAKRGPARGRPCDPGRRAWRPRPPRCAPVAMAGGPSELTQGPRAGPCAQRRRWYCAPLIQERAYIWSAAVKRDTVHLVDDDRDARDVRAKQLCRAPHHVGLDPATEAVSCAGPASGYSKGLQGALLTVTVFPLVLADWE
eukprot:scaffold3791_cov390-Prasinococcus_capsulatus_cf.AAC.2